MVLQREGEDIMQELQLVDACTQRHFEEMSLLHALGWRTTYAPYLDSAYMAREITDTRWIPLFQENFNTKRAYGLILYRGDTPVSCATYCPIRDNSGLQGADAQALETEGYEGWGEISSFYSHPGERGKGYGSLLMKELLHRLQETGYPGTVLYVLRENLAAKRFYERHGFAPDGGYVELPFPPDFVNVDVRYVRRF